MIEVRDLDDLEIYRFYGWQVIRPLKGYAARRGLRTVTLGGVALGDDGKIWGFLDHTPDGRVKAIYRYMLRFLEWARQEGIPEIYVTRNPDLETSEQLLRRAGFTPCGDLDGHEIWIWKVENNG